MKKKLISFSEPQSSSKSTLHNRCMQEIQDCVFVPEITRTIKDHFGVSINEQGTLLTQSLILGKHTENYFNYLKSPSSFIMDRCIWDGFVYTNYLLSETHSNVCLYAFELFEELISKHDIIFYTSPYDVPLVDDGVRSANINFRTEIINSFEYTMDYVADKTQLVVLKGTVDERMETIKSTLKLKG